MAQKERTFKENFKLGCLITLLRLFFFLEQFMLGIKHVNYPKGQFLLSIWHCHQCLVHGVKDKSKFYVLISASNDGEIVAKAIEVLNLKSVRGSTKRRGAAAALELIEKLNEGNSAAIMVDGPRGPKGKVKDGIVNIAKITGVPIIPVAWGTKDRTMFKFNSWDRFQVPIGFCKTIILYGDPIYVPADLEKEDVQKWCEKVEHEMNRLQKDLDDNYDKYKEL